MIVSPSSSSSLNDNPSSHPTIREELRMSSSQMTLSTSSWCPWHLSTRRSNSGSNCSVKVRTTTKRRRSNNLLGSLSWTNLTFLVLFVSLALLHDISRGVSAHPTSKPNTRSRDLSRNGHHHHRSTTIGTPSVPKSEDTSSNSINSGSSGLSLSIVSPLEVLRQKFIMEIHRQRIRHAKHRQIEENKDFLDRIG